MTKIMKLAAFVLLGLFLYTQAFSAMCCKNGVLVDTCAHPGYDDKGRELSYDISACMEACPIGKELVNGKCVDKDIQVTICPEGYVRMNGNCVPLAIADQPFCFTGSTYNPVTKQCEYTCEDGTKVTSLANCPVNKECEAGQVQYQPCDKNGVNCGTQERTCSNNKWTAWGTCKVL